MEKITPELRDELLAAIHHFGVLAKQLIAKLIAETDQPEKLEIAKGQYYEIQNADLLNGGETLSDNWYFDVHGEHCLFRNAITSQTLEVYLGNEESIANLDPAFFYRFLQTTPNFKNLAECLGHPFNGTLNVFVELEDQGLLKHVGGIYFKRESTAFDKI